jgi:hypothetical protein
MVRLSQRPAAVKPSRSYTGRPMAVACSDAVVAPASAIQYAAAAVRALPSPAPRRSGSTATPPIQPFTPNTTAALAPTSSPSASATNASPPSRPCANASSPAIDGPPSFARANMPTSCSKSAGLAGRMVTPLTARMLPRPALPRHGMRGRAMHAR